MRKAVGIFGLLVLTGSVFAQPNPVSPAPSPKKPKVIIFGVNGAELDVIRPLIVRGEMPNLAKLMANGVSGSLRTLSAPNCPKAYTTIQTSLPPEKHGITGFIVDGKTA